MTNPTVVQANALETGNGSGGAAVMPTMASNVTAGNLLVCAVFCGQNQMASGVVFPIQGQNGWSLIDAAVNGSNNINVALYTRRAVAGDNKNPPSPCGSSPYSTFEVGVLVYELANAGGIELSVGACTTADSPVMTNLTSGNANDLALCFAQFYDGSTASVTSGSPGSWTTDVLNNAGSFGFTMLCASQAVPTSGSTVGGTITTNSTNNATAYFNVLVHPVFAAASSTPVLLQQAWAATAMAVMQNSPVPGNLILCFYFANGSAIAAGINGWTLDTSVSGVHSTTPGLYWRYAISGDTGTYSSPQSSTPITTFVCEVSGAFGTFSAAKDGSQAELLASGASAITPYTTVNSDVLVLMAMGAGNNSSIPPSLLSGMEAAIIGGQVASAVSQGAMAFYQEGGSGVTISPVLKNGGGSSAADIIVGILGTGGGGGGGNVIAQTLFLIAQSGAVFDSGSPGTGLRQFSTYGG